MVGIHVLVSMPMAEKPLVILNEAIQPFQEIVQHSFLGSGEFSHSLQDICRSGVGYDVIHLIVITVQGADRVAVLIPIGHLLRPPGSSFHPQILVSAVGSAHHEEGLSLDLVHVPAHQVANVAANAVYGAAVPLLCLIRLQQIKILVVPVAKADLIGQTLQLIQKCLLLLLQKHQ